MALYNSSRYVRLFIQQQTSGTFGSFNNSSGVWSNTGAQVLRIPENGFTIDRSAPYTPFPAVTGDRSTLVGIRGRKGVSWEIRGMPFIPSGVAGTVPDSDVLWQCAFGQAATIVSSTSCTYALNDLGFLPVSLLAFAHGSTTLTSRAMWGGIVQKVVFNFNGPYMTADISGAGGFSIDNIGFSVFDTLAKAGLTAYPIEPVSPTINGNPIAGFGTGWTATIATQALSLKVKVQSITFDTGLQLVEGVYGSPYAVGVVGGGRSVTFGLTTVDDDSAALNAIKIAADTDNTTIGAVIVAGNVAGSIATWTLKNIQPNEFNIRDNGELVDFDMPTSMAHETTVGALDELTMALT